MDDKDKRIDRIEKLKQRFTQHAVGRPKRAKKSRGRESIYLDIELTDRINQVYKDLDHELYPKTFSKSLFLETLLEYSLENLSDIKKIISEATEAEDNS